MKFIILVIFTFVDGSVQLETAATSNRDFCLATVALYEDAGRLVKQHGKLAIFKLA